MLADVCDLSAADAASAAAQAEQQVSQQAEQQASQQVSQQKQLAFLWHRSIKAVTLLPLREGECCQGTK